jgi:hypothetical protein
MSEITARPKYACPSCGAEAQWDAGKQALVCVFCGTVSPAKIDNTGAVVEHDLVSALRSIPDDQRGWQADKVSVKCQSCQAITVFDAGRVGQRCDFCGSSALIPSDQVKAPLRPESLLPFKLSESEVREKIRAWYQSRWFAPDRLKSAAHTETVKGFYLPYWTFDAQVAADWTAQSGFYYYETEYYQDSDGRQQTRQVQRTRWEPSCGHVDHFFDDDLVPASVGAHAELLRKIEPFPTKDLVPYDPGYLAGWIVEQYQIDLIHAAGIAREDMQRQITGICEREVPGDTHMNLQVQADYSAQTFKHILLPVWLLSFNYDGQSFQVVVNGVNGAIGGNYPKSWIKITLAVFFALVTIAIILLVLGAMQRH